MTLGSEIVDLIRLHGLHDANQAVGVRHVAIVEEEPSFGNVRILIQVIDTIGIEQRSAALDAVNFVVLGQQEFRKVSTILPGDTCDKSLLHIVTPRTA